MAYGESGSLPVMAALTSAMRISWRTNYIRPTGQNKMRLGYGTKIVEKDYAWPDLVLSSDSQLCSLKTLPRDLLNDPGA